MEFVKCNLCDVEKYKRLFLVRDYLFPKDKEFQLVRCLNCGLVFLNPRPTIQEIHRYYPQEYYLSSVEELPYIKLLQINQISLVERFKKKGRLLDIGCGSGIFLSQMEKRGWDVYGIEYSQIACEYARDKFGLKNIYRQDIGSIDLANNFFDVVTMWHAIEHFHNPLMALEKVKQLLKAGGILIIICPNFSNLAVNIFRSNCYLVEGPRHLFYFTAHTLSNLLKKTGFKKEKISHSFFLDPAANMVCWKKSFLRQLRLEKYLQAQPYYFNSKTNFHRSAFYYTVRFLFNLFCFVISLSGILGRGSVLLACASKERE